ncbi:hypothetical protein SDC9_28788 [bioreactor metagenome]|uniref:Uncharacterized protein n=1 Tax=bioreactor metagenome TaxID=1076179 RepID=A0A644UUV2_9ZZZZ
MRQLSAVGLHVEPIIFAGFLTRRWSGRGKSLPFRFCTGPCFATGAPGPLRHAGGASALPLAADPDPGDGAVVAHHDRREQLFPEVLRPHRALRDERRRAKVDGDQVGLHPRRDVADKPVDLQRPGRALRRQPPQLRGVQRMVTQLRHLIGCGHGAQHRETRAAAGVGGQPHPQPGGGHPGHVEKPRANEGVRGRAMGQRRADLLQPHDLARLEMDGVAIDPVLAEKAEGLVGVEVVARLGKEALHPGDLVELLAQMGLHQAIGMLGPERAKRAQLLGRRCRRETRRDDIAQPVAPVPACEQRRAFVIGRLCGVAQPVGGVPVHAGAPAEHAHAARAGLLEIGVDARRMDCAIAAHRGSAVAQRQIEIERRDVGGMARIGKAGLGREGVAVEPVDQPLAPARDHLRLRVMHMGVDEARRDQLPAEVGDLRARVSGAQRLGLAHGGDLAVLDRHRTAGEMARRGGPLGHRVALEADHLSDQQFHRACPLFPPHARAAPVREQPGAGAGLFRRRPLAPAAAPG